MFLSTSYTALLFGQMVVLIEDLDISLDFFKSKMDLVNANMRYLELPKEMQTKIRNYFEYLWIRHKSIIYGHEFI